MSAYDSRTQKWFRSHPGAETTVVRCKECGLYYKPILGHTCRKCNRETERKKSGDMLFAGLEDAIDMS